MIKARNSYYTVSSVTGYPIPLNATASGKIVLAHMNKEEFEYYYKRESFERYTDKTIVDKEDLLTEAKKIYENGYSIEDEEIEIGIYSVATPIYITSKINWCYKHNRGYWNIEGSNPRNN